jgi:hypothetical protein
MKAGKSSNIGMFTNLVDDHKRKITTATDIATMKSASSASIADLRALTRPDCSIAIPGDFAFHAPANPDAG